MKNVAIIPARKNSKGVPGKNKRLLNGLPLVCHSIIFAQDNPNIDRVVINTDDADIIKYCSKNYDNLDIYQRDSELSKDDTPMVDVLLNYIKNAKTLPELIILLQPTSPIRSHKDLDKMLNLMKSNLNIDCVISVSEVPQHYSPHLMLNKFNNKLTPLFNRVPTRRQDVPPSYIRDGQIYIFRTTSLLNKKAILTDNTYGFISSEIGVNIDCEEDWTNAVKLLENN
ncbi:acylneuraminate cytidylyltransferase family protein [Gammaproteobacteria bacterium]|nr:acylneuraminate cytidylyltransferase family protein [Gammaproteobacteria bacterium]